MEKIAVLGGGHGGRTMAADLTLSGFEVQLWVRTPEKHLSLLEKGTIRLKGLGREGEARINRVTTDIERALEGVELVFVAVPSFAHSSLAQLCAPHLRPGQIVVLTPGTFGSFEFAKKVKEEGGGKGVIFAETATLPYGTRRTQGDEVMVFLRAVNLPTGIFPASLTSQVIPQLQRVFPVITPARHILDAALDNPNPIVNPITILLNIGNVETYGQYRLKSRGTTDSVLRILYGLDGERVALRRALGLPPPHFLQETLFENKPGERLFGGHLQTPEAEELLGRQQVGLRYRYITEDVAYGLVFFSSLGDWLGVPTPLCQALSYLASSANQTDYFKEGRTMDNLGLSSYKPQALLQLLHQGWC